MDASNTKKLCSLSVRLTGYVSPCYIIGFAIAKEGSVNLVDNYNHNLKLFSKDMEHLSSASEAEQSWDVTMSIEHEAVVTSWEELVIKDVADNQLWIKTVTELPFAAFRIFNYKDKLIVTTFKNW